MRPTPVDAAFTFAYFTTLIDECLQGEKRSAPIDVGTKCSSGGGGAALSRLRRAGGEDPVPGRCVLCLPALPAI